MEYPSNANMPVPQSAQPPAAPEKPPEHSASVISGTAKVGTKKKSVKGFIFAQDFKDIKDGVMDDIIRPKIKDIVYKFIENIVDSFDSTLQMMIFGDVRRSASRPVDRVSYNQYSSSNRNSSSGRAPSISASYNCDDITYESRGDAEAVLAAMREWLDKYPYVEVSRMYEFSNRSIPNFTSNNYGWDNLDGATVKRTIEGDYLIELPRAKQIPR